MSPVSAHGRLNVTHDSCPYEHLPGVCIAYVCIEAAILTPWNAIHRCLPGSGRRDTTVLPHVHSKVMGLAYFSLSPCWSQLPEAPTLGWHDESLMASGFHIRVVFLSCVLYPCLYYILCGCISLSIISILVCIGHMVQLFITLFKADYITEQWVQV